MSYTVGLIGDPVSQSLSPMMQAAAFTAAGIEASYQSWQTREEGLADRIASLRAPGMLGANITIPYKVKVLSYLDELAATAERVGAVNTIVTRDGRLIGHNTDIVGLATALQETGQAAIDGALVLGAGGAARAAVAALYDCGARQIGIAARRADSAKRLATELAGALPGSKIVGCMLPQSTYVSRTFAGYLTTARIIVNATPVGLDTQPGLPLAVPQLRQMRPDVLLVDTIARDTQLLQAARSFGFTTLNGIPMLLHQGALSFTLWTDRTPPLDAMKRAIGLA